MQVTIERIESVAGRDIPPFYLATAPIPGGNGKSCYYGIGGTEWGALEDLAIRFSLSLSEVSIDRLNYR